MRRKRLFYVPGLISLIFLPILIVLWVNDYKNKRTEYSIVLSLYENRNYKDNNSSFYNYYKIPARRNYIPFEINQTNQNNKTIYETIELYSKAINTGKDSIYGLKILFKNISYNSFIQTINSCLKSKIQTYFLLGDTLFVYYTTRGLYCDNPKTNIPKLLPPFIDYVDCMDCVKFKTHWDYVVWKINKYVDLIKRFYPILICLILLIIFTIRWNFKISGHTEKFRILFMFVICLVYLLWILMIEFI